MSSTKSRNCHYHKKHRDFHIISEIRQWIIDFWYNFIKRLKNVLSERRLSRMTSLHAKSVTNISNIEMEKNVCRLSERSLKKLPKKSKKSRKNGRKLERKKFEIFEDLSDDYLALYKKKSCSHLTPKKSDSKITVNKKWSYCSMASSTMKSTRHSRHSTINIMIQEVTQQCIGDGSITDLNWLPKCFGCILPSTSTSKLSLRKIENKNIADNNIMVKDDDEHDGKTDKLVKLKATVRDNFKPKPSKIPRLLHNHQHSMENRSKARVPYSKHHRNCINN